METIFHDIKFKSDLIWNLDFDIFVFFELVFTIVRVIGERTGTTRFVTALTTGVEVQILRDFANNNCTGGRIISYQINGTLTL